MKKVILLQLFVLFMLVSNCFGALYEFTGFDDYAYTGSYILNYNSLSISHYIDGVQAGSSSISTGRLNSKILWDIDPIGMNASWKKIQMDSVENQIFTKETSVYYEYNEGGFGGETHKIDIPYKINVMKTNFNLSFDSEQFPINSDLSFQYPGELIENKRGTISFEGALDILDESVSFNLNENVEITYLYAESGYFDDSLYPNNLGLFFNDTFSSDRFIAITSFDYKIFETTVDGHLVELYISGGSSHLNSYEFDGTLVPEPATLALLGLGCLLLRHKKS